MVNAYAIMSIKLGFVVYIQNYSTKYVLFTRIMLGEFDTVNKKTLLTLIFLSSNNV